MLYIFPSVYFLKYLNVVYFIEIQIYLFIPYIARDPLDIHKAMSTKPGKRGLLGY